MACNRHIVLAESKVVHHGVAVQVLALQDAFKLGAADKGTFVRMRNVMMNIHSGLRNSLVESAQVPMHYMEKLSYLYNG